MEHKIELVKELDNLLLTIKNKKNEISDLDSSINNLNKKKIDILSEINKLQNQIKQLLDDNNRLNDEIKNNRKIIRLQLLNQVKESNEILNREKELNDCKGRLELKEKEISKKIKDNELVSLRNKKICQELNTFKNELVKKESKLNTLDAYLIKKDDELKIIKEEYHNRLVALDNKQREVIDNLNRSSQLKEALNIKISENEALKIQLNNKVDSNNKFKVDLDCLQGNLLLYKDRLEKNELKIKQKEKELSDIRKDLDLKDSEIQIRSLRLEKIIREKGIKDELKKLEDELNGR